MPATSILQPAAGESLLGTEPQLLQRIDPGWRHRLNLFTGRTLTDTALDSEQLYRSGLLTVLGQSVTPGTVSGLGLTLDPTTADPTVSVSPGFGIAATGAGCVLNRTLKTPLSTVAVINGIDGGTYAGQSLNLTQYHNGSTAPGAVAPSFAGILLLQPVIAQVSGKGLDTKTGPIEVTGNLAASCSTNTSEYSFEDWQIADAVRLVFLPWPTAAAASTSSALSLGLPLPAYEPAATLRNRLAYSIFEAETLLGPDDQFPWAMLGVPLAVVAFDAAHGWKAVFIDCSSVVRAGGLPRRRYVLPLAPPPLRQWSPNTSFAISDYLIDASGNIQTVQTPGVSGAPPPSWALTPGSTTTDGSVVWGVNGPARWKPNLAVAAGQFLYDDANNLQYAVAAGTTGPAKPGWQSIFLATKDGSVTWINNGNDTPPIVQPALAEARVRQLSEQLSDSISQGVAIGNLANLATVLPPSGLLPVAAVDFNTRRAPWLPANWRVAAAPVLIEELEAVIATGMTTAPLSTVAGVIEPVELLVPLPDALYDPNILITESVSSAFQQELDTANAARNLTLQQVEAVQTQVNSLLGAIGPNRLVDGVYQNPSVIDPDAGLTSIERAGRNAPPPYIPTAAETFGSSFPTTWNPGIAYAVGDFILDGNGGIQVAIVAGTSSNSAPTWNATIGQTSAEGPVTANGVVAPSTLVWLNNGPFAWQSSTPYVHGQFIVDTSGILHFAFADNANGSGTSAATAPEWKTEDGNNLVYDGIVWKAAGSDTWRPDVPYTAGQLIFDSTGGIQVVQNPGISGDSMPVWNPATGATTSDSAVVWRNLGRSSWQPQTRYDVGQAIVDSQGLIQAVAVAGTSGAGMPAWSEPPEEGNSVSTTVDSAISWKMGGSIRWTPNTPYKAGQVVLASNGRLQVAADTGLSGTTEPVWSTVPAAAVPAVTIPDANMHWRPLASQTTELQQLKIAARQVPYVVTFSDAGSTTHTENLISDADLAMLDTSGLQTLITSLRARIARANDLLDVAFLTCQTDIYRYRQNVLGTTAATTLATSTVLFNIAQGTTASATSENLQSYYASLYTPASTSGGTTTNPTAPGTPGTPIIYTPISFTGPTGATAQEATARAATEAAQPAASVRSRFVAQSTVINSRLGPAGTTPRGTATAAPAATLQPNLNLTGILGTRPSPPTRTSVDLGGTFGSRPVKGTQTGIDLSSGSNRPIGLATATSGKAFLNLSDILGIKKTPSPTQIVDPGINAPVVDTDITSQSPLVGAQLNLRTLTIAQRLAQSPSQEAMFYAIANRLSFVDSLVSLEKDLGDLGFVINDLEIPVDGSAIPPAPVPILQHTVYDYKNPSVMSSVKLDPVDSFIKSPSLLKDAPEATLFSVGVRVVEQHTALLRALEGRVQDYADFVTLCTAALTAMQTSLTGAGSYLAQLTNQFTTERQNIAFASALLADETNRVACVNAQRQSILATSVRVVAYTRARTIKPTVTTPSRQLVPANVTSPVPACIHQTVSIPPELREIVGQLREAPVAWLPACVSLMQKLERSTLLLQLAVSAQSRAEQQLRTAQLPSSAEQQPGVYAGSIARAYHSNRQVFRGYQVQRASFQPALIANLAWKQQIVAMQSAAAVNDLISAESVHAEVSNAVARLIQQISSVATCLYTRVSAALPIDRLAWAEFLQGPGASVSLASLATLPRFSALEYTDRQQLQLLVDWLFQQIDPSFADASAFISDVIRTAFLLASDVPLDNIIPTSVLQRTTPTIGGQVSLNLVSDRVASGMIVNLYSAGILAARAVVSDHDASTATATITDIFKPNVRLETTDMAHFTAQAPNAVAFKSFFRQN